MNVLLENLLQSISEFQCQGDIGNLSVQGISRDSRYVKPGDLFVCISGVKQDGHLYAAQSVKAGAVALVVERFIPELGIVPQIKVPNSRLAEALMAACFYGYPSRELKVVGVTGTNGKTTSTYLMESIIQQAGHQAGIIGTIGTRFAGKSQPLNNTTPSSLELNGIMRDMRYAGCDYMVMEVSSHALDQGRVEGLEFDIGVFTNITRDHLDYHKTMEDYLAAKCILFKRMAQCFDKGLPKRSIVNIDDPLGEKVVQSSSVPVITYAINKDADVRALNVNLSPDKLSFTLKTPLGETPVCLGISGLFNVYNSLAAAAMGIALGFNLEDIRLGLENVACVPGRFQRVDEGQDFLVLVDYAHTDDALLNLLKSARQITKGKIIIVFGAGGDRDRGKRPLMGEIAARHADYSIITSDNPRSEDPALIAMDIELGIRRVLSPKPEYKVVLDREDAIREAINMARPGDSVLIAGKGHETYEIFADRTIHFDDVEMARKYLQTNRTEK